MLLVILYSWYWKGTDPVPARRSILTLKDYFGSLTVLSLRRTPTANSRTKFLVSIVREPVFKADCASCRMSKIAQSAL